MPNQNGYSISNLPKLKFTLATLIDAIELNDPKNKYALKIAILSFKNNHIEYQEGLRLLTWAGMEGKLFEVLNEKLSRWLRESNPVSTNWQKRNESLRGAYYKLGVIEEDLSQYFLLDVKNSNTLEILRSLYRDMDTNEQVASRIKLKGKNLAVVGRILDLFRDKDKVENWKIINATKKYPNFTKTKYEPTKHLQLVRNRCKTIKKYLKKDGFTLSVRTMDTLKIPIHNKVTKVSSF